MWRLRSDLPLGRDASTRFLPSIVGFMVYLGALSLAGTMALDKAVARWHAGLDGTMTVQIPPIDDDSSATRRQRLNDAVAVLTATPGVAAAEPLDELAMTRLLQPWLGDDLTAVDLPLPDLIAVTLRPGAVVDTETLAQALATAVPGAALDDHGSWRRDLRQMVGAVRLVAATFVALVGIVAAITVVFVTRTGLAIHHGVIEVVHLIGARDAYIARQFQYHALRLGLLGGVFGIALATGTLLALVELSEHIDHTLLPSLTLTRRQWIVLWLLPVAVAALTTLTARITVLRALRRRL